MAFLDATVVNVALPAHRRGPRRRAVAGLQWTINGYTLTLAALILLGGSLGDRFGRRRVFVVGVAWFARRLAAVRPRAERRGAGRGPGAAGRRRRAAHPGQPRDPGGAFRPEDRARAIGAWSGLGGVAGALGPFLGGWLVQAASWRLVFLINLPLAIAVVRRHAPPRARSRATPRPPGTSTSLGALLGAVGLGGTHLRADRLAGHGRRLGCGRALAARRRRRAGRVRRARAHAHATRCCRWTSSDRGSSTRPTW